MQTDGVSWYRCSLSHRWPKVLAEVHMFLQGLCNTERGSLSRVEITPLVERADPTSPHWNYLYAWLRLRTNRDYFVGAELVELMAMTDIVDFEAQTRERSFGPGTLLLAERARAVRTMEGGWALNSCARSGRPWLCDEPAFRVPFRDGAFYRLSVDDVLDLMKAQQQRPTEEKPSVIPFRNPFTQKPFMRGTYALMAAFLRGAGVEPPAEAYRSGRQIEDEVVNRTQ